MTTQQIQFGAYGKGVVDQSGGTFTDAGGYPVVGRFTGGSGVYNISGGTLADSQYNTIVGEAGTGVLNVSGSGVVNILNQLSISSYNLSAGTGTVNLAGGGKIIANQVSCQAAGGRGLLNFSGGTLQSRNANPTFLQNLTGAYVYPGGATIQTAVSVMINQPLLAPTGYGAGGVAVTAGGAGYLGEPIVTLSGGGGSGATARAIVNGGQITGIQINNPGSGYGSGDVLTATLAGGGAVTAGTLGTVTLVPNSNAGGLTKAGSGTLILGGSNTYNGGTTVSAGTLRMGNAKALGTGGLTANNGTVDLAGYSPTVLSLAGSAGTITNSSSAALSALTVAQAATTNFGGTLQDGSGSLALVLNGPGTLILSGSNDYSGGTVVDAGTLIAASDRALRDGSSLTVGAGGTFVFDPTAGGAEMDATARLYPGSIPCRNRARSRCWARWDHCGGGGLAAKERELEPANQ